jgi:hypothetical protein
MSSHRGDADGDDSWADEMVERAEHPVHSGQIDVEDGAGIGHGRRDPRRHDQTMQVIDLVGQGTDRRSIGEIARHVTPDSIRHQGPTREQRRGRCPDPRRPTDHNIHLLAP